MIKKLAAHLTCLLLVWIGTALAVRGATVELLQATRSDESGTNKVLITVQGPFLRIDFSDVMTFLLDGESGYACQMLHPAKAYIREPLAEFAARSPCAGATNAPVPTGNSKVISGCLAFEYRQELPCGTHTYWAAADYPDAKKLQAGISAAYKLAAKAGMPDFSQQVPGIVVQSESVAPVEDFATISNAIPMTTNISTVISIATVPDDPALAQIPEGYQEVTDFSSLPPPKSPESVVVNEAGQEMAWARQLESHSVPHMASLARQFASRPSPQMAPPPAAVDAGVPKLSGTPSPAMQPPPAGLPGPVGDTFTVAAASWGQHGEQVREVVITNAAAAKLLWSNSPPSLKFIQTKHMVGGITLPIQATNTFRTDSGTNSVKGSGQGPGEAQGN